MGGLPLSEQQKQQYYGPDRTGPYVLGSTEDNQIDGACFRWAGSMCNGSSRRRDSNVEYTAGDHGVHWLRALRPIYDGEELIAYYGGGYGFNEGSCHATR